MSTHTKLARVSLAWKLVFAGSLTLAACLGIRELRLEISAPSGGSPVSPSPTSRFADEDRRVAGAVVETSAHDSDEDGSLQALFRSYRREQKTGFARQLARFLGRADEPSDPVGAENARNLWIHQLTPRQTSAALDYLDASNADETYKADLRARLIRQLAATDMASAIRQVNVIDAETARELALENVVIVQASAGLENAINWVNLMPAGTDRDVAAFAVANEAVRSQPTESLRLAADLPASDATDELIRRAVVEWAAADQPAATTWAQQLPDEPLRTQVLGALALLWADRDPGAAAEFALNELTPGRDQNDALVGVAQRWAQRSPQEAAAWVGDLPAGQLRQAAADSVTAIWARSNLVLAHTWRKAVGAGP